MTLLTQIVHGGVLARAVGLLVLASLGVAVFGRSLGPRRRGLLAAGLLLGAAAAGYFASRRPAWRAIDAIAEVRAGAIEQGCGELARAFTQEWTLQRLDGAAAAMETCVDRALDGALVLGDNQRELALLAIAAADAPLTPTAAQFRRIHGEVQTIPGAFEVGKGRVRLVSFEVSGPAPLERVRSHGRDQLLRLMGCHAVAHRRGSAYVGAATLTLRVDATGVVDRTAMSPAEPQLARCVSAAFDRAELGGDGPSRVTIETTWKPFPSG
jgi:hypothetical protein